MGPWLRELAARGSNDAGFSQPRAHRIANLCRQTVFAELRYCYSATALNLAHPPQIQSDQSPDQMHTAAKDGDPAVARLRVQYRDS